MSRAVTVGFALGVVLAVATVAAAQQPRTAQPPRRAAQPPRAAAQPPRAAVQPPRGPAVGSWAAYRWTPSITHTVPVVLQQTGPAGQVTWSVAQETVPAPPLLVTHSVVRGDRRSYTLQIVTQDQPDSRPLSITQVTVDRATGKALRSVIRAPKGAVPTPESGVRPLREADVAQGRREEVTVPAGSLAAVRGGVQGAEGWVSDQVPLGLVKAARREGTLELVASGTTGATDLLRAPAR